jgi:hypothetical protein
MVGMTVGTWTVEVGWLVGT